VGYWKQESSKWAGSWIIYFVSYSSPAACLYFYDSAYLNLYILSLSGETYGMGNNIMILGIQTAYNSTFQ
jgi:hypothetical protein